MRESRVLINIKRNHKQKHFEYGNGKGEEKVFDIDESENFFYFFCVDEAKRKVFFCIDEAETKVFFFFFFFCSDEAETKVFDEAETEVFFWFFDEEEERARRVLLLLLPAAGQAV